MVGQLGNVSPKHKLMLAELAKAGLVPKAHQQVKMMTYGQHRQLVNPDAQAKTDTRHRVMEKWVQAALNVVLGLRLKLDGEWTGDVRAALQRFQREEGLHSHGFLDDKTLQALEERLGMRAPREGRLQGSPRLWMLDKKEQDAWRQRPTPPPDKPARNQAELQKYADTLLQREAVQAAARVAFERPWVDEQRERKQLPGDAALHAQMLAWFEQAQTAALHGKPAAWWPEVERLARTDAEAAAVQVRQAWLQEQGK